MLLIHCTVKGVREWGKEVHVELQQLQCIPEIWKRGDANRKEVLCQDWYSCWETQGLPVSVALVPSVPVRGCLYLQKAPCSSLLGGSQQELLPGHTSPWHQAASLAEILPASGEQLLPLQQDTMKHHRLANTDPPQGLHRQEFALGIQEKLRFAVCWDCLQQGLQ